MLDESKINRLFLNYNIFNELKSVHGVRTGVIIFGLVRFSSVFIKKSNQTENGSNRFGLVFSVLLGFFPI
jgi:hypothetical protein